MKKMQRKIRIGILVLVGCLLFSSCTVTGPPKTETTKFSKDTGPIAIETAEFHKVKEPTVMESTETGKIPEQPITQVPESGYKGYEWLYGDLHMHTLYSDGRHLYWDVIEYCIQAGFNYVATTDHNTTRQNYEEYREEYGDLIIIPGVEDTVTDKGNPFYSGHFNVLGLKEPPVGIYNYNSKAYPENYNIFEDGDEIFKQVSEIIRKAGGKITINHPFSPKHPWKRTFDKDYYDYLEVWNHHYQEKNRNALDFWQKELEKGYVIPAVGGTDSHKETVERTPYNVTYVRERSMEGIFEALSAGHNYIISNPKTAPTISFLYGNYMMGDVAKYESDCKLEISISDIKGKAVMILYNQMGIMCEIEINDDIKEYNYKHEVSSSDLFYRIEIMDGDKVQMLLVTNPIYFR